MAKTAAAGRDVAAAMAARRIGMKAAYAISYGDKRRQ